MKTLKFKASLVPLVLSGEKDSTWRLFDEKNLQVNDQLSFVNKETGQEFAKAIIIALTEKKLGELQDSDFQGHEKFESQAKMYAAYKDYYGDRVTPDSVLKMIKFKLIE